MGAGEAVRVTLANDIDKQPAMTRLNDTTMALWLT